MTKTITVKGFLLLFNEQLHELKDELRTQRLFEAYERLVLLQIDINKALESRKSEPEFIES